MNINRLLATAAMTASLAIGLAANATATPEDDFWECVGDHQDTDGIGVCCVFYGGTYDERTGECWDYPEATIDDGAGPGSSLPPVKPGLPVLTPAERLPVASRG